MDRCVSFSMSLDQQISHQLLHREQIPLCTLNGAENRIGFFWLRLIIKALVI